MLRVGLTGEIGSGKSTVARLLAAHGAHVFSSDEMARAMMRPGHSVYQAILGHFGASVLLPDGALNRTALAALAFDPEHPRVEELNAIIHPAVIAEQQREISALATSEPAAVVVVESALLLTTKHAGSEEPWRHRFDLVVLVTATDELKIQRFLARAAKGRPLRQADEVTLRFDAERRLAAQRIPAAAALRCIQVENTGDLPTLTAKVDLLWQQLQREASKRYSSSPEGI